MFVRTMLPAELWRLDENCASPPGATLPPRTSGSLPASRGQRPGTLPNTSAQGSPAAENDLTQVPPSPGLRRKNGGRDTGYDVSCSADRGSVSTNGLLLTSTPGKSKIGGDARGISEDPTEPGARPACKWGSCSRFWLRQQAQLGFYGILLLVNKSVQPHAFSPAMQLLFSVSTDVEI